MADFDTRFGVNGGAGELTTASVAWSNMAAWTAGQWYNSPDISSIIQEIVNQGGWTSGNNMALTWNDWANAEAHKVMPEILIVMRLHHQMHRN